MRHQGCARFWRRRQHSIGDSGDKAASAYQWWTERDCPDRQQFHLTVTRERQWIWLDAPANIVTP
jgi:hypothetical protein